MDSLTQLLSGSLKDIYSANVAHAAPRGGSDKRGPVPTAADLVDVYNNISGRSHIEGYDDMDRAVQNETYAQEGTWGLSITHGVSDATKRVETQATIQLNRAKQQEAPIGWELSSTFMAASGHFIGSLDQDGIAVRVFTGIGPVSYQGNHQISYGGDEDSTGHTFSYQPREFLNLGYKYQAFSQGTQQTFSASTKVDTIGLGLETTFAQGNIICAAKVAKKWYFFATPDVKRGEDATEELQKAERNITKSQVLTAASINTMGDITVNLLSKIGFLFIRDFALAARISPSQGKVDVKGACSFMAMGRRIKMNFDQDAQLSFGAKFGVWGDSCLDVESKLEVNPILLATAAQMPVISAKLNWNVPTAQDDV